MLNVNDRTLSEQVVIGTAATSGVRSEAGTDAGHALVDVSESTRRFASFSILKSN